MQLFDVQRFANAKKLHELRIQEKTVSVGKDPTVFDRGKPDIGRIQGSRDAIVRRGARIHGHPVLVGSCAALPCLAGFPGSGAGLSAARGHFDDPMKVSPGLAAAEGEYPPHGDLLEAAGLEEIGGVDVMRTEKRFGRKESEQEVEEVGDFEDE